MNRIRDYDNRIKLQQLVEVFVCERTCTSKPRFFTICNQGTEFRVIVPYILICHFSQEAHGKEAAGEVVVGAVDDGAPVDKEEQRCIENGIDNLNYRKYMKYLCRKKVGQSQITEEEINDPVKKGRSDAGIDQRSREILQNRHFISSVRMTAENNASFGSVFCLTHHIEILAGPLRIQLVCKWPEQDIFHRNDNRGA